MMRNLYTINLNNNSRKNRQINIIQEIREAWIDHVMLERFFIISTVDDLGDLEEVTRKLQQHRRGSKFLQNIYGIEKSRDAEQLFKEHIALEMQLINQLKVGNVIAADMTRSKLYQNADNIAEFLSSINPNWDKDVFQSMLYEHINMTEDEAKLRFRKQYADDIALYDEIKAQALDMADIMSEGIIKQFNI